MWFQDRHDSLSSSLQIRKDMASVGHFSRWVSGKSAQPKDVAMKAGHCRKPRKLILTSQALAVTEKFWYVWHGAMVPDGMGETCFSTTPIEIVSKNLLWTWADSAILWMGQGICILWFLEHRIDLSQREVPSRLLCLSSVAPFPLPEMQAAGLSYQFQAQHKVDS